MALERKGKRQSWQGREGDAITCGCGDHRDAGGIMLMGQVQRGIEGASGQVNHDKAGEGVTLMKFAWHG